MTFTTPDLCDDFPNDVQVCEPIFTSFGGRGHYSGQIVTVKCHEDNSKVKQLASQSGQGRVIVVDGGGSLRRALLGDMIAANALDNGWAGFVIYGCVRDVDVLSSLDLGVHALAAIPLKTEKRDIGDVDVPIRFAGVNFKPGNYIYADNNGVIVSSKSLFS